MTSYRYWFLAGSFILIFMGAMLKLDHYANYNASFIGGIANMGLFVWLTIVKNKRIPARKRA